jgi:predicted ATP-binding protein involved in virulence
MALLNPHLGKDVVKLTPGIVLIDELDTYLHPTWQRRIVDALKKAFPRIQFVITTHSPFIIQSLHEHELIKLTKNNDPSKTITIDEVPTELFVNRGLEDVAEEVQDVNNAYRNEKMQLLYEKTKEYYNLIDKQNASDEVKKRTLETEIQRVEEEIANLEMIFSNDEQIAYHAIREIEREKMLRRNGK